MSENKLNIPNLIIAIILLIAITFGSPFIPVIPKVMVNIAQLLILIYIAVTAFRNIFLPNRFFVLFGAVAVLFAASFGFPFLYPVAQTALALAGVLVLADIMLVFNPRLRIQCSRKVPKVLSLGDKNQIKLELSNWYNLPVRISVIDEVPHQFQNRDFNINLTIKANENKMLSYDMRPLSRGEYHFANTNIFAKSFLGLVQRRFIYEHPMMVPVYPSIQQMKQYELTAFTKISLNQGIKKMRRLGHSYEFEQIKNYVLGDDYRSINWKATGRRGGQLMVNQYEDERAQQIYCLIDKSRTMKLPFNGLNLMDYAINTSLVISNIALLKHDRAGLLTFSDKIGNVIKAEKKANQLNKILMALYREKERKNDANFELLYRSSRRLIKGRSLLFLFTNFESFQAMERVLPILRKINNLHLLVVVFFENTEVIEYTEKHAENTQEIYYQTIAQRFVAEKRQIVYKLQQYGIQSILTSPEELSINTINKYLELKSRGLI